MEEHHRRKVLKMSPNSASKTVVLDIPDIYYRGNPILVELIKSKVLKYL
jgi:predicted protein tyrosine phosphatase